MSEIVNAITPWIAVISVVVAGYITLRNQMRLKAFELLLARRTDLLNTVEDRINFYHSVLTELDADQESTPKFDQFRHTDFHDSLILFHRAKGVALGPLADALIDTYWSVSQEVIGNTFNKADNKTFINRKLHSLAVFYGFAHSRISSEIESLALSPIERAKRLIGIDERLGEKTISKESDNSERRVSDD